MTKRRRVIVHIGTSADGYIARPDGDLEWLTAFHSSRDATATCPWSYARSNASTTAWFNCDITFRPPIGFDG